MYTSYYGGLDDSTLSGLRLFGTLAVWAVILLVFAVIIGIVLYVLQAIAISDLAKKNNVERPWLAWIPVANMYLLGKLGFDLYAPKDKQNKYFKWVLFWGSLSAGMLSGTKLGNLASAVVWIFMVYSLYFIFKKIKPTSCTAYTVLSAIFGIGTIILFFNRKNYVTADGVKVEAPKEAKAPKGSKFCSNCGAEIKDNSKFCPKCGNKL